MPLSAEERAVLAAEAEELLMDSEAWSHEGRL